MAIKSLLINNVEIIVGTPMAEIRPSSVILESGKKIQSDLTVWTVGIKGYNVKTTPQIEKSKTGRIFVDEYSSKRGLKMFLQ
jgi:NADH dehydrogenase FAD-containing subunit